MPTSAAWRWTCAPTRAATCLLRMAPNFDVFVENYGPGVIERLHIGYDVLRDANPGLIYARIKGFGTSGPYADFRCMDMVAQAAAGAFSITGEADGPPMMPGPTTGDSRYRRASCHGDSRRLRAEAAHRRGPGDRALHAGGDGLLRAHPGFHRLRLGNARDARSGNAGGLPPVNIYACKPFGPNDYIYLMPVNQGHWDGLCAAMDRGDLLIDPRFETTSKRMQNGEALYAEISNWTAERTKYEAMETIAAAGVPCAACLDTAELHHDKHLTSRGFVHHLDLPVHGEVPMLGFAPRMSASDVPMTRPPRLGEHTDEVLTKELDLDGDALSSLRDAGVIGDPDRFA